jgi:6-pyruvoyl-tetrahydropterin synthase
MITGVVALSEASNLCLCVTALLPQHRGLSRFLYTAFPTIPMKGALHCQDITSNSIPRSWGTAQVILEAAMAEFELNVNISEFRFSCAHFIAHNGVRERLHGHNYTVAIRLVGKDTLNSDGYLVDFSIVKKEMRAICKSLHESFICPMKSSAIKITEVGTQLCMECDDGSKFSFPLRDCSLLPIHHSSVEQLAHYVWCKLVR